MAAPFDKLIIRDGEIVEYVPRADRAAEVLALITEAVGAAGTYTGPPEGYRLILD